MQFFELLEKFFSFSLSNIDSARTLAIELAKRTRVLKDEIVTQELKEENAENTRKYITGFYEAFTKYLIADLSKEDFSNLILSNCCLRAFRRENEIGKQLQ